MHLVIVESPAKCKTIQQYLGKDYVVLASYGHVRDLPSKEGSVLPDEDFAMRYEITPNGKKSMDAIMKSAAGADSLILATDPDREGEAISWHVVETLRQKKKLKPGTKIERVVFSSITKDAIKEAISNPRQIDEDLVNAQQARRALDYLVGFTLSPVLWRKLPGSRSAGRVQSVALRLICDREQEIEAFKPQEYWDLSGKFAASGGREFTANLTHLDGEKLEKFSLPNETTATAALNKVMAETYHVASIEKKQTRRNPYAPFTTSTLQQEASRKLGFSAKQTMQIAQKLYEGIELGGETTGLITYMRTDGVDVAPQAIMAARETIGKLYGDNYVPKSPRMYQSKAKNAQEAHEAIRPTSPARTPESIRKYISGEQFALYELIWKRMIASQMEAVVMDQVAVVIDSSNAQIKFRAVGSTIRFDGFYRLYHEGRDDNADDEEEREIPPLDEKAALELREPMPAQHFTEPPPRYSEASLVKRLEELGIGRPSTYASIISVLQERDYVVLDKKRFVPEPRGRIVTAFLYAFFRRYVEYDFTAKLEDELDDISAGKIGWKEALTLFWKDFSANVNETSNIKMTEVIEQLNGLLETVLFPGEGTLESRRVCPSCSTGVVGLRLGKFGAFLGCSRYPECNFTKQFGAESSENGEANAVNDGASVEPKLLGSDPKTLEGITLKKGPYGWYVQRGDDVKGKGKDKEKPKRVSLPKGYSAAEITLEQALALLTLPRTLGEHPESGKPVKAGIGRFGPYIQHDKTFASIKGEDDVLSIGMNRAMALLAEKADKEKSGGKGRRFGVQPLKILGNHPKTGKEIAVFKGRYGPYLKHDTSNITLPKGMAEDSVTLEQALVLIEEKGEKSGDTKTKGKAKASGKKGGKRSNAA